MKSSQNTHFQLTHDYLVPSIRNWLNHDQHKSWRGRAALRLRELEELNSRQAKTRYFPSLLELLKIYAAVPRKRRSITANMLLRDSRSRYATMAVVSLICVALVGLCVSAIAFHIQAKRLAFEHLLTCDAEQVPDRLRQAGPYYWELKKDLHRLVHESNDQRSLRAAFAILAFDDAKDSDAILAILNRLPSLRNDFENAATALSHDKMNSVQAIQEFAKSHTVPQLDPVLISLDLGLDSTSLVEQLCESRANPDAQTDFMLVHHSFLRKCLG